MQDGNNNLQILICHNWYTIIYASDSDTDQQENQKQRQWKKFVLIFVILFLIW